MYGERTCLKADGDFITSSTRISFRYTHPGCGPRQPSSHRIYHRSHVCRSRTSERRCRRQKWLHHKPLCISRIASISQALTPIMWRVISVQAIVLSLESLQIRRNHNSLKSLSFFFSPALRTFWPKPFLSTARMVSMTRACGLGMPDEPPPRRPILAAFRCRSALWRSEGHRDVLTPLRRPAATMRTCIWSLVSTNSKAA
jgi:hypothetical protein